MGNDNYNFIIPEKFNEINKNNNDIPKILNVNNYDYTIFYHNNDEKKKLHIKKRLML